MFSCSLTKDGLAHPLPHKVVIYETNTQGTGEKVEEVIVTCDHYHDHEKHLQIYKSTSRFN